MANFSLPTLTSTYANFVTEVKSRDEDIIKMLDGVTPSNLPSGAKRWNAISNKFEKYNGSTWSVLTTLYEIKVADSNKLNGQLSTYYATADHNHNLVYAALSHTHDYSPSTHNHDSTYLGKTATAADSTKIGGYLPHLSAFGNTAAIRDANGDLTARYFKGSLDGNASSATTAGSCSGNAATATTAANASKLNGQNFYWSGQDGQPTWLWGGNDGVNHHVYNPSNFNVNYANSAGSTNYANSAGGLSAGIGAHVATLGARSIGSYEIFEGKYGDVYNLGANVLGSILGATGTWRCMGYKPEGYIKTLFLRIA